MDLLTLLYNNMTIWSDNCEGEIIGHCILVSFVAYLILISTWRLKHFKTSHTSVSARSIILFV